MPTRFILSFNVTGNNNSLTGYVCPLPDLAAVPTSTAPIPALPVDSQCTLGLHPLGLNLESLLRGAISTEQGVPSGCTLPSACSRVTR